MTPAVAVAALQAMARWPPHLLLLDLHLTDMDGFELLARARRLEGMQEVPAVAVSADAMPDDIARALQCGFVDYWTKPLDIEKLRRDLSLLLSS